MADYWEAEIQGGDLLYFPAGWPHEVITFEESFGLGGAVVNDFQVIESMRSWLWEYSQSGPGNFDYVDFIQSMSALRPRSPDCVARTAAALQLHADWAALKPVSRYGGAG
jgi:ribosomal protein L16 Arg81 hydroxylase